jgi:integrase
MSKKPKAKAGRRVALTVPTIKTYKPNAERREIIDSLSRGLRLVVQPKPSGRMSWIVRLRRPNGKSAKITIGPVNLGVETSDDAPVLGAPHTLAQARVRAAWIDDQRARRNDVVADLKTEELRKQTATTVLAENNFGACVRSFIVEYRVSDKRGGKRPRRWREDAAMLGLRYSPRSDPATVAPTIIAGGLAEVWGDKPVAKIDGHDIFTVVDAARRDGGDSRARKLHAAISILFTFLQRRHRVPLNPAKGGYRPGPPPDRDCVLTDDGIRAFWKASERLGGPASALFKILLLTGARLREVANMSRAELGDDGVWACPGSRTKNNRALLLPLPRLALDIIHSVAGGQYVFSGRGGRKPIANFTHLKKSLDAEMATITNGRPVAILAETKEPVTEWRIHDLRRTFGTNMQKLGVAQPVTERLLNHVSGGSFAGVAGIYGRFEYADEKADALHRWARHLEGLTSGEPSNVTDLASRKQARVAEDAGA